MTTIKNSDHDKSRSELSPLRIPNSEFNTRSMCNIFKRNHLKKRKDNFADNAQISDINNRDPLQQENRNMIVKAFEYGFLKARKRAVVNGQLNEIKQSQNRDRAIKDVLEFTMKY